MGGGVQDSGWEERRMVSLGWLLGRPKASEPAFPGLLGLWGTEDRLTEGPVLSIGPEDSVVGKGAPPQLRGLGRPLQLGPSLANVP